MHANTQENENAILVAIDTGAYDVDRSLEELSLLAETAGINVVGTMTQPRVSPDKATFIGKGKLEELVSYIETTEAQLVIFDHELNATQIRNIEKACDVPIVDRTMLILDIFAENARTSEGRLQVDLAQHKYLLPRLSGMGVTLSRLAGGGGGGGGARRGKGESKLELDRRNIRTHIQKLEKELGEMERRRLQMRERRKKDDVTAVAIIGYTNVGKSTLLNKLTDAGVLVENKLFATLDPTARALVLPDGRSVMLIDTVGLVSRLPHHLVEAFKSTLEEAVFADLLLNVADISNENVEEQISVTLGILDDLGVEDTPVINVLNKVDCVETIPPLPIKNNVFISAKTGQGLEELLMEIAKQLPQTQHRLSLLIPYSEGSFSETIRRDGKVFSEEFKPEGIFVEALVDEKILHLVERFKV